MLLTATSYGTIQLTNMYHYFYTSEFLLPACDCRKVAQIKDKSHTFLFRWVTLWKKQVNNKSRRPRLGAAMRDPTVSIKIYSTEKRKVWTQTVWQTQNICNTPKCGFLQTENWRVCRTNLKAVCLLNIWVIFSVQIS